MSYCQWVMSTCPLCGGHEPHLCPQIVRGERRIEWVAGKLEQDALSTAEQGAYSMAGAILASYAVELRAALKDLGLK